jgi:D-alanyl-D-alanine carboxypeptidase
VGPGKHAAKVAFADFLRRHRFRFVAGALILIVLVGLGLSSAGIGEHSLASYVRLSAEQASHPSHPSHPSEPDGGDVPDWTRENEIQWHLMLRSREQDEAPRDEAPREEATCGHRLVLVDRSHALPQDYAPDDLVSLPAAGVPTVGGRELMLRREAAEHLEDLVAAAAADGEELVLASAFRSYLDQTYTHERLKSIYGSGADTMSASPGHSQHQLGTAVDFTNSLAAYQVQPIFGQTTAAWWLQNHATQYGFVLSYPPGKDETGYQFEPWHYRYIGVENAGRLQKSGLTLQEFLLREHVLPDC